MARIGKFSGIAKAFSFTTRKARRGLTLLEMAIALGVLGIVFAGLWAAAAAVNKKHSINESISNVSEISGTLRSIFTGFRTANPPNTIAGQVAQNFFPASVVRPAPANTTTNPWQGTYFINFDRKVVSAVNSLIGFSVEVSMSPVIRLEERREACHSMLVRLPGYGTNYAAGFAGSLPAVLPAIDVNQGTGPMFAFVSNAGVWVNVTGNETEYLTTINPGCDCRGVAFYFKL